ncbi:hypothetical protein CBL_01261 [Carabus blaptoides fortunei]
MFEVKEKRVDKKAEFVKRRSVKKIRKIVKTNSIRLRTDSFDYRFLLGNKLDDLLHIENIIRVHHLVRNFNRSKLCPSLVPGCPSPISQVPTDKTLTFCDHYRTTRHHSTTTNALLLLHSVEQKLNARNQHMSYISTLYDHSFFIYRTQRTTRNATYSTQQYIDERTSHCVQRSPTDEVRLSWRASGETAPRPVLHAGMSSSDLFVRAGTH